MVLPSGRRPGAVAGGWLAVCLAVLLGALPVPAAPAQYQGWFENSVDGASLSVPCGRGPLCDVDLHLYPTPDGPSAHGDWQFENLFRSSAMVTDVHAPEKETETWACVLPAAGIPDGQSAPGTGLEGQRLYPEIPEFREKLIYDPNAWPAYCCLCLLMATGFIALACCFEVAKRVPFGSHRSQVQGDDPAGEVFVANLPEACQPHGLGQFAGAGKPAHRFGQIGVSIPAAGQSATDPREHAAGVPVV
jgi:hypothetical protein